MAKSKIDPSGYDINALLAGFQKSGGFTPSPPNTGMGGNFDVAKYILTHSNVQWDKVAGVKPSKDTHSRSTISRILDVLSRGDYAVSEMMKRFTEHNVNSMVDPSTGKEVSYDEAVGRGDTPWYEDLGDILHGGISGLAGTRKTTMSKMVQEPIRYPWQEKGENDLITNGPLKFTAGLLGDIALDPLTYLGMGPLKFKHIPGAQHIPGIKKLPSVQAKFGTNLKNVAANASNAPVLQSPLQKVYSAPGAIPTVAGFPTPPPVGVLPKAFGSAPVPPPAPVKVTPTPEDLMKNVIPRNGMALSPAEIRQSVQSPLAATPDLSNLGKAPATLHPEEIDKLATGNVRTAAQILTRLAKDRGVTLPKSVESSLRAAPDRPAAIKDLLQAIKESPVNVKGLEIQATKAGTQAERLAQANNARRVSAQLGKPLVGPGGIPNVEKAGDILERIKNGDITTARSVSPPPSTVAPPNPTHVMEAEKAAQDYAEHFFKGNSAKFSKTENNPIAQANFFQGLLSRSTVFLNPKIKKPNSKVFQAARFTHAYRMLKAAEEHMTKIGYPPVYYDGSHIRLSDVIDMVGGPTKVTDELFTQLMNAWKTKNPAKITNPEVRAAIEKLRTRDALRNAEWVRNAVNETVKTSDVADEILSPAKLSSFQAEQIAQKARTLAAQGVAPSGVKSYKTLANSALRAQYSLPQKATIAAGSRIQSYITPGQTGIQWARIANGQTRAIGQTIGQSASAIGQTMSAQEKWLEWFGTRFQTFYGQKDFRPDTLAHITTAANSSALRNNLWQDVGRNFELPQIQEAFKLARGAVPMPNTPPEILELSARFQKSIESLFGSTGLTAKAMAASTVATRSGMLMNDINKQLKLLHSEFLFTNARKVPHNLNTHTPLSPKIVDYSKGSDWLKSWESAEIKNPLNFMINLEHATEQLMHQYVWMDEVAAHFGSPVRNTTYSGSVNANRLKGVYFDPRISTQVQKALDTWAQVYDPKSNFIKNYDQVLRTWKTLVTIPNPAHHVRNLEGDMFLSFLAGVNNPDVYRVAAKAMKSQRSRYQPLKDSSAGTPEFIAKQQEIESLIGLDSLQKKLSQPVISPGNKAFTTRSGVVVSYDALYAIAQNNGLLNAAKNVEELVGDPLFKFKPFGGKVTEKLYGVSEVREHWVRLSHLVDEMKKSKGTDLAAIGRESAAKVRKWHPDGLDLTNFERSTMRRIIPFYSWTRKSIPLILESLMTRPGRVMVYPKTVFAGQQAMGINSESPASQFPGDQLFPNWLRSKGIGPMFGSGTNDDYTIVNPSTPVQDTVAQFGGVATGDWQSTLRGLGAMLTPGMKVPFELASGTTMQGIPIQYDTSRYLTEQIPVVANASRLTNFDFMGETERGKEQGHQNFSGWANFLLALGITPTQKYIQQSRFEEKNG